jgi:hypothetical protein
MLDDVVSAVMLSALLGAVYIALTEGRAKAATPTSATVTRDERTSFDPLDFTPDMRDLVQRLRAKVGAKSGNLGAIAQIEWHCRRFAMLVYRRVGRDPDKTSRLDASRAVNDLAAIRADIVNAVQSLYVSVHGERLHAEIDAASDGLMRSTAAYIRAVRKITGSSGRNEYDGGRGFPTPWNESADPHYDMLL